MDCKMKINGDEVNRSTCSPSCIGYFDDNSTLLDGFAIERVRDQIAANLQKQQETPSSHSDKKHRRQNSPPMLEEAPGSSSHPDKKHRRQNSLPTLEEDPGSSEHNARSTERVRSVGRRRSPSPQLSGCASTLSTRIIGGGLDRIEVKRLNNTASGYARRGNEKKALKTYKQALRLTKLEVARIQRQMQNAKEQPDSVKKTVHVVLHDEWTKVALAIADIRTMMAIIYERIGHYEKAILCCNEARDVYERQYTFDKKHHCENSTAKDNAARMSHMALKMEDASDSFELRQDLHAYSLKTHQIIMTTADKAVRDMLYEALFDKLSAALGLELESLGHNHPQVAETLAFLSKLYLERSDTPKALKTMERAVSIAEVSLGAVHPKTGQKYYDIARMYETVERGKTDTVNALHFYEKAIETYKECDGDHSRLLGSILNDVGVLHIQREQYDVAVQKLSDALASYESSIGDEKGMSADTVQVWRNLAECYVLRKEWESATMAFTSALDVQRDARKLYDTALQGGSKMPMPPIISDESIGDTLKRLGKSYATQKKYEISYGTLLEALTIFQTAYDNAQEITKKAPGCDVSEKQDQVASVIFCIAEVKEADKKYGEAIRLYEEALQLRIFSDKQRPEGKKSNHVHCAMCMAGIGSIRIAKKQYKLAFKAFNKAIQCTRRQNLGEIHPIVQMLWERSRAVARKMEEENSPKETKITVVGQGTQAGSNASDLAKESESVCQTNEAHAEAKPSGETSSWFHIASRLEKRAQSQKSGGDLDGAIQSTKHVLEFRRAYLSKRIQSNRSVSKAKHHVAHTLVGLAHLVLIANATKEAEIYLKGALDLYKSSGVPNGDDCVQEIKRELDRLRWQTKRSAAT